MQVQRLFLSPGHNYFGHHGRAPGENPTREVKELLCVAGRGIEGDRFFGYKENYKGQVTFFAEETWEALCEQFQVTDRGPEVFRRNVLTRGADLNALVGQEFEVQGVRFLGTEESRPCEWMNQAFAEGAHAAMRGRGGLRARVLSDGILRRGPAEKGSPGHHTEI